MRDRLTTIKESPLLGTVKDLLSWRFFPFITAAVILADFYLGWDLVSFYFVSIIGIAMLLLLEDLSPMLPLFLLMNVMISVENSPSPLAGGSDFYFKTEVLTQIAALVALFVAAALLRLYFTVKSGKFKITPTFWGLCLFSAAFLFNGIFSSGYDAMNLLYGVLMAFFFLVIFAVLKDNVVINRNTVTSIAFGFMALACLLTVELITTYIMREAVVEGIIYRNRLFFGWGTYNYFGMLALICLPSAFYLAGKYKYGYLFFFAAIEITAVAVMSMSRQAILGIFLIFPACLVFLLMKGKNKLINGIIAGAVALALIICAIIWSEETVVLFSDLFKSLETGSGRISLWKQAWTAFKSAPLFGTGFFVELAEDYGAAGINLIPDMYHNTIFQLLGSCGIIGLASYIFHRVQTVISFFKNPTVERVYLAVTIIAMLVLNLLDNHLFYMLPTLVYSALLSAYIKAEEK